MAMNRLNDDELEQVSGGTESGKKYQCCYCNSVTFLGFQFRRTAQ